MLHWHKEKVLCFDSWNQYTLLHSSNKLTFDISSSTDLVWRHFTVGNISDVLIEQFNWLTYFWWRPGSALIFSMFSIGISIEPLWTIAALKWPLLWWDAKWELMLIPPALSPKIVILFASPPKAAMFLFTHFKLPSWSHKPEKQIYICKKNILINWHD